MGTDALAPVIGEAAAPMPIDAAPIAAPAAIPPDPIIGDAAAPMPIDAARIGAAAAATPPMPIIPVTWLPASMPVSGIPIACVVFGANCDV